MSLSNTEKTPRKRRPRFRRAVSAVIRLQERDIEIFKLLYDHRFLNSRHITSLIPGSDKGLLRRLCTLYHGQYLDRPREQLNTFQAGTAPMVYALGNKAADVLYQNLGMPRAKVDWTSKNRNVGTLFLDHQLMVSNFLICLQHICYERGDIRIIRQEEIFQGKPSLRVNTSRKVGDKLWKLNYNLAPDKIFGLFFKEEPSGRNRAFFLLEADRSTMPIKRSNLYRTSFFKKLIGYWDCQKKGLFKKTFGIQAPRVITLALSQERIENMIQACNEVDERAGESGMFLFSLADNFSVEDPGKALTPIWRSGNEEKLFSLTD